MTAMFLHQFYVQDCSGVAHLFALITFIGVTRGPRPQNFQNIY